MATLAVDVKGLTKSYGSLEAVKGIDLEVATGEIFALLGPNGAGKTTTVEILEGHRDRSSGEVSVLGLDPGKRQRKLKQQIGIVLQSTGVEPHLTVAEVIELYRGYYPSPRPLDDVIDLVGLGEKRDERVKRLSGGQLRRLDVAVALAGDPALLFLDEPTTGFDPSARRNAWHVIKTLASLGKTIFLTTHYMDEAQYLADRVGLIVDGRIVAVGSPDELTRRARPKTTITFTLPERRRPPADLVGGLSSSNGVVEITTEDPTRTLHELTGWALREGAELQALTVTRPSLEDVYLELTKTAGSSVATE